METGHYTHQKRQGLQRVSGILLVLPIALEFLQANGFLSSGIAYIAGLEDDYATGIFRTSIYGEIQSAAFAVIAFALLYRTTTEKVTKRATGILIAAESYMLAYNTILYIWPVSRNAVADATGNIILFVSVIASCYAWSLMVGSNRLKSAERAWAALLVLPYIMSFTAFYSPTWQQYIPQSEGNVRLLPEYTLLYTVFAGIFNILRAIALWKVCHSGLFGKSDGSSAASDNSSPLNKYIAAIVIASFFVIQGLALVYRNADFFNNL